MSAATETASLAETIALQLGEVTLEKSREWGLANARANAAEGEGEPTVLDLAGGDGGRALVVGAGPSLHRRRSMEVVAEAGFDGVVVATDGALRTCLAAGVKPRYVVSLDPHPSRIVRWFGDPDLDRRADDDYFRRQDLDPGFHDEAAANRAVTRLVDDAGPGIVALLASSVSPAVARRCRSALMRIHWWNPLYDDPDLPGSMSRAVHELNGAPCLFTGGNCGTAAWTLAHTLLGCTEVGLVGFDFSYHGDTGHDATQYYHELVALLGADRLADAFVHHVHPDTKEEFYTDPTYHWYRQTFLEMAPDAPCRTVNCTEGGILFGDGLETMQLARFLRSGRSTAGGLRIASPVTAIDGEGGIGAGYPLLRNGSDGAPPPRRI